MLSVGGNADEAVEAEFEFDGINSGSLYQCLPLILRRRLYSSCVLSNGSENLPVRKENEVALQLAEMRMVRWMCCVKVKVKS